ncbi:MAG: NAD(P)H-binding protein [Myxococcaceae bacterium]|nr:NAD(P)H-binding protein [Myxococcaceae bacterium]
MKKTIVVVGATRGTGLLATETLLAQGRRVRVVVRNTEKAHRLFAGRVEVHQTDLSRPGGALDEALAGADGLIFTAGVPPGLAREASLEKVDYGGLVATIRAAERAALEGRFVYMTTMGIHQQTWLTRTLNVVKWNLLAWRRAAEEALLASSLDGAVIRAGLLTNGPAPRGLDLAHGDRPVTLARTLSRADAARVLVAALEVPAGARDVSVFGAAGSPSPSDEALRALLGRIARGT